LAPAVRSAQPARNAAVTESALPVAYLIVRPTTSRPAYTVRYAMAMVSLLIVI
jgi:hypothetical protein